MNVVIAGASGFIGHALVPALQSQGHNVIRLVRRNVAAPNEATWLPENRTLDRGVIDRADVIVNLAGENIGARRWSAMRREQILRSRIDSTRTLVDALRAGGRSSAILINASAVGYYGERGDEPVAEDALPGQGFLPTVCAAWESEALRAAEGGARVVILRLGLVLGRQGGALAAMLPVFRWGVGGRLGTGRQWMSWIHRDDVVALILNAITNDHYRGPINAVSPQPVTNHDFTAALGRAVRRPAALPVSTFALRALFGQMADEALLTSTRAVPARLMELGFQYRYPALADALAGSV